MSKAQAEIELLQSRLATQKNYSVDLKRQRDEALEKNAELEALFDLQWTRTQEADALYVAAHPDPNHPHGYKPDLGELVRWLVERGDEAREAAREILAYFANRESDVWGEITTKHPWLEEDQ